jgi:small subunit ribosomal protein S23
MPYISYRAVFIKSVYKTYSAIRFVLNLHYHHNLPLSDAYSASIAQFRALRSEHDIATTFAALEAEHYGSQFGPTETETGFARELNAIKTWDVDERYDQGAIVARKRWKAVVERDHPMTEWTGGQQYAKLWREGVRPDYSPASTQPVFITEAGLSSGTPNPVTFEPRVNQPRNST